MSDRVLDRHFTYNRSTMAAHVLHGCLCGPCHAVPCHAMYQRTTHPTAHAQVPPAPHSTAADAPLGLAACLGKVTRRRYPPGTSPPADEAASCATHPNLGCQPQLAAAVLAFVAWLRMRQQVVVTVRTVEHSVDRPLRCPACCHACKRSRKYTLLDAVHTRLSLPSVCA